MSHFVENLKLIRMFWQRTLNPGQNPENGEDPEIILDKMREADLQRKEKQKKRRQFILGAGPEGAVKKSETAGTSANQAVKVESSESFSQKSGEQKVFLILKYGVYAFLPLVTYFLVTFVLVLFGSFASGYSFDYFREVRRNIYMFFSAAITMYLLMRKSRNQGNTFFEDASLYRTDVKLIMLPLGWVFGASSAFAMSCFLTLIPKGWISGYIASSNAAFKPMDALFSVLASIFLAPVLEEIIFRGYMLNRLLPHVGEWVAVIISSFVFAIVHMNPLWFLYALAFGWLLCKLSIREDNILYGIFIHSGFNAPSALMWMAFLLHPEANEYLSSHKFLLFCFVLLSAGIATLVVQWYRRNRFRL